MTRRQVRAVMRRMREHQEEAEDESGELNLVPYLDIITNIIIFLLASVIMNVSFGNVNVTLPTISAGGGATDTPEKQPLNLTVTVGSGGFIIAAAGGVLGGTANQGPTIPKLPGGQYDFKALTAKLGEIKAAPENAGETKVNFNADAYIPYEIVVQTLDAMREDASGKPLFPDVIFAAGIL